MRSPHTPVVVPRGYGLAVGVPREPHQQLSARVEHVRELVRTSVVARRSQRPCVLLQLRVLRAVVDLVVRQRPHFCGLTSR